MDKPATTATSSLRDGSTLYYSLMFSEASIRARVVKTLQLIHVISTTLYEVSEPAVAEKKIHWWHEELERLAKQQARHPACVHVQEYLHKADAVNALVRILSAASNERYTPAATDDELHEMISADYSARLLLINASFGETTSIHCPTTALALGQTHRLTTLGIRFQHGYAVFSDESYAVLKTTPERLSKAVESRNNVLASMINRASHALINASDEVRTVQPRTASVLPIQIMVELRSAQLNLWKKKQPDLLNEYLTLTPLRKYFLAYRTKRRFAKS